MSGQTSPIRSSTVKIEQSDFQLSTQSIVSRQRVEVRREATPVAQAPVSVQTAPDASLGQEPQGKLRLMKLVAEMMLGKKIHVFHGGSGRAVTLPDSSQNAPQVRIQTVQVRTGSEQVRFHAQGSVETLDGRSIDFQSDLSLARQFVEITARTGPPPSSKDPLVLNFDGRGVRLGETRINFDLNADGQTESVPTVASGSGVLFADKNGDGVANNGSELFGPQTGDGFGELAHQDSDGNGWIDENDPVFGELRVWFQDSADPGAVYSLKDLGVGALSTARGDTPFDLDSSANALLGQIRASGIYLREDGRAGVVSHVDLVI